jgi:predicted esterase
LFQGPNTPNPRVSIIVPARNEQEHIQQTLRQLLTLDYDNYEVIAVNDRSTDRTGEILESIEKNPHFWQNRREVEHPDSTDKDPPSFRVVHHRELPAGWLGKTHAMWTAANAARYNGDAQRIAIGGDSAGGNLTAATLISLAEQPDAPKFKAALLLYAMLDIPRAVKATDGNPEITRMMIKAYLGERRELISDPRVTPLNGIKAGIMPPTLLIVGTADNLVPDTYAMAELLRKTETPHEVHVLEDMPHAFLQIWMVSGCAEGLRLTTNFLKRHV